MQNNFTKQELLIAQKICPICQKYIQIKKNEFGKYFYCCSNEYDHFNESIDFIDAICIKMAKTIEASS